MNFLMLFSIIRGITSEFDVTNIQKGIILESDEVTVLQKDLNTETLKIVIEYPFQPVVFKKNVNNPTKCKTLLQEFDVERVQKSIDLYFMEAAKFLEIEKRQRRQALLIGTASLLGYFSHTLIDKFLGVKTTINTEKYLTEKIENIMCQDLNTRHQIFELKEELRAREIIDIYFKTIEYDNTKFEGGKIYNTQAQEIFEEICININTKEMCEYLVKFGEENVEIIGRGFTKKDLYTMQIKIHVPRVNEYRGFRIQVHKILLPTKQWYKTINLESEVISYNNRTVPGENCKGNEKFQLCEATREIAQLNLTETWKYETKYIENKCIPQIFEHFIVLTSKVKASIQYIRSEIETKILEKGLHIYARPEKTDILITCGKETFKILYSRFQNRTFEEVVSTKSVNLTFDTEIDNREILDFEQNNEKSRMGTFHTITLIVNFALILVVVYCVRNNRKIKPIVMEKCDTISVKSIKV